MRRSSTQSHADSSTECERTAVGYTHRRGGAVGHTKQHGPAGFEHARRDGDSAPAQEHPAQEHPIEDNRPASQAVDFFGGPLEAQEGQHLAVAALGKAQPKRESPGI